jgi:hypothetical protein
MNGIAPVLRQELEMAVFNGTDILDNTFRESMIRENKKLIAKHECTDIDSK